MSLYGQYIKEREDKEILEDSRGYATYQFLTNGHCYIESIYVLPEHRKDGVASHYADEISKIAKKRGFTKLMGSVCPTTSGSTDSLKVLLAYGFTLDSCNNNFIIFIKDLGV